MFVSWKFIFVIVDFSHTVSGSYLAANKLIITSDVIELPYHGKYYIKGTSSSHMLSTVSLNIITVVIISDCRLRIYSMIKLKIYYYKFVM